MRAVVCDGAGGVEVLGIGTLEEPVPGPGDVLIDVAASAVNRADLMQREGNYPPPPEASSTLGLECSGTVRSVGEEVTRWSEGDAVVALLSGGGYAERVVVPEAQVLPAPDGVDLVTAAALPEVTATVWSNVFMLAALQPDETLLVHGGSSGIGTMTTQLAVAHGARVAVTAGSADKLERCHALGASILINYHEDDFVELVREATTGAGADVILDNMGAAYLARNVDVLAVNGRLVVIGMQGGIRGELNLATLLGKRGAVLATSLRGRPAAEKARIIDGVREHVWPLVCDGTVRPVVHQVFALADVREAHQLVESSTHVGKVLLRL